MSPHCSMNREGQLNPDRPSPSTPHGLEPVTFGSVGMLSDPAEKPRDLWAIVVLVELYHDFSHWQSVKDDCISAHFPAMFSPGSLCCLVAFQL